MNLSTKSLLAASFIAFALVAAASTDAFAQATRTYVSGVGDDANPCSRTAPCKTFAGAISKTAEGGTISAIDSAGYGTLTITKSITIDGGPHVGGVLSSGTFGITVNAGSTDVVVLRNLSIEGGVASTYGVRILSAASVHIEDTVINAFPTRGIDLNAQATTRLSLINVSVRQSAYGVEVHTGRMQADRLVLQQNGNGLLVSGPAVVNVRNSNVSGSQMGFAAAYSPYAFLTVDNSVTMGNEWGIVSGGGATVRVGNSRIIGNFSSGLYNDGASYIVSLGGNALTGNFADGTFTSTITIR